MPGRGMPKTCVYYGLYENGESCLGFSEIAFVVVVDTHLPRFEALAYVFPHCDELTHVVIRASSRVCWRLLFCLRKAFIFQEFSWRSIVDLCLLNLSKRPSFKSFGGHKVNLPSCVARRPLRHKVNLPRCEARRRRFIMACETNEHFWFIRKNSLGVFTWRHQKFKLRNYRFFWVSTFMRYYSA